MLRTSFSLKAPGNFHKNKVILYWSHWENLLPLPPCSVILEASFSCTQADPSRDSVSCSRTHMQGWFMPMWVEPKNPAAPMRVVWIIQAVSCICKFVIWVTWFTEYMTIFTSSICYTVYVLCPCMYVCMHLHHKAVYYVGKGKRWKYIYIYISSQFFFSKTIKLWLSQNILVQTKHMTLWLKFTLMWKRQ